jgi:hypothetical protein
MYPDVVVAGGGILSALCAYYLQRSVRVRLAERDDIASEAGGAVEENICHEATTFGTELPGPPAAGFVLVDIGDPRIPAVGPVKQSVS